MKKENFTMKELPDSEKPYEKCERDGAKSLSNAELLAVILKSGTKDKTSLALALEVLSAHPSFQGLMGLFHLTRNQASSDSRNWSGEGSSDFVCGGVVQTTGKRE